MAGSSFPYFNIVQSQLQYLEFCLSLFRTLAVARSMGDTRLEMIGLGHVGQPSSLNQQASSMVGIHGALAGRPEGLRTLSRQQGRNEFLDFFLSPFCSRHGPQKKRLGMRRAVARLTLSQQNWKQVNKQAMGDGNGWVESMELHVCQSFLNLSGTGETPPLSETLKRDMKLVEDVSNMYQNVVSGHPSRIKFISCSMVQRCSESRPAKTGLRRGAARRICGLWLGAHRASCDWEMMVFLRGKKGGPPSNP